MNKAQKKSLIDNILKTCLFSEYLPSEFSTELLNQAEFSIKSIKLIPPISLSMDKFNDLDNRRFIAIPEVTSFIHAVQALKEGTILDQLIKLNNDDQHSLSKILNQKQEIKRFSDGYGFVFITKDEISSEDIADDFLNNLNLKLEKSRSCKYILHLDIANFFNSIYTHNISALIKGESWANDQFQLSQSGSKRLAKEYSSLKNIDSKFAEMNLKRTHGLLVGPRLSFIIAESLLTQIDKELASDLAKNNIDFVRFVDDYDVFIKDEKQIRIVKDSFNQILQKYGLLINDSKTKLEEFPFYTYIDFETISNETTDLSNQYAKFGQIEKSKTQNGALLYFCENILSQHTSSNIALSLSFSILKNISKALMSSCKNIANFDITEDNSTEIYSLLIDILKEFCENHCDLESIWVIYTLLKLFPDFSVEENALCSQLNEVALVVYMYESKFGIKEDFLKDRAKGCGWLLNYELFYNDIITEDELMENMKITNISSYKQLKDRNIHFYIKKQ